jgi:hypothetical protein
LTIWVSIDGALVVSEPVSRMRHTHATHALERGVDLTTVRDNLRHASLSTTSIYLHTGKEKRARQLRTAFAGDALNQMPVIQNPSSEKNQLWAYTPIQPEKQENESRSAGRTSTADGYAAS